MCSSLYSSAAQNMAAQAACNRAASAPELVLMIEAYLRLLKLSHQQMSRTRLQGAMAQLRDEIACISGWKSERVQDTCEAMVALLGKGSV